MAYFCSSRSGCSELSCHQQERACGTCGEEGNLKGLFSYPQDLVGICSNFWLHVPVTHFSESFQILCGVSSSPRWGRIPILLGTLRKESLVCLMIPGELQQSLAGFSLQLCSTARDLGICWVCGTQLLGTPREVFALGFVTNINKSSWN